MAYEELETDKIENKIIEDKNFFEEIKRVLRISWEDDDTDSNIKEHIKDGVAILEEDVKSVIDFTSDFLARRLLKTYCRYAWNNSEEYFIENNLHYILKLEVKYGKS